MSTSNLPEVWRWPRDIPSPNLFSSIGRLWRTQLSSYDFFYKNGVPVWRGTGYYYSRFRPGLGVSGLLATESINGVRSR